MQYRGNYLIVVFALFVCLLFSVSCESEAPLTVDEKITLVALKESVWDNEIYHPSGRFCFLLLGCNKEELNFWERPISISLEMSRGEKPLFLVQTYNDLVLEMISKDAISNECGDFYFQSYTLRFQPFDYVSEIILKPHGSGIYEFRLKLDMLDTNETVYSRKYRMTVTEVTETRFDFELTLAE